MHAAIVFLTFLRHHLDRDGTSTPRIHASGRPSADRRSPATLVYRTPVLVGGIQKYALIRTMYRDGECNHPAQWQAGRLDRIYSLTSMRPLCRAVLLRGRIGYARTLSGSRQSIPTLTSPTRPSRLANSALAHEPRGDDLRPGGTHALHANVSFLSPSPRREHNLFTDYQPLGHHR